MSKRAGSGYGTSGALLELAADIYYTRARGTELGGGLLDSGAGNSNNNNNNNNNNGPAAAAAALNNLGLHIANSGRCTTALQSRIAEAIGKTSDRDLVLSSRRWLAAVYRAVNVLLDDHPQTPLRRGFVGTVHDLYDMRLLSAPSDLVLPGASASSASQQQQQQQQQPSSAAPSAPASPSATAAAAGSGATPSSSAAGSPSSAAAAGGMHHSNNTDFASAASSPGGVPAGAGAAASTPASSYSPARTNTTATAVAGSSSGGGGGISASIPCTSVEILRNLMLRPAEILSCQWVEGGSRLRALVERPVSSLRRELDVRALAATRAAAAAAAGLPPAAKPGGGSTPESFFSTLGDYEGLVLQYIQDESSVWSRVSTILGSSASGGVVGAGGGGGGGGGGGRSQPNMHNNNNNGGNNQSSHTPMECHGFGVDNVSPTWHCESRFVASQFAEPSSLMLVRTPGQVVVALPWGERERVYGMLFLPPHLDDRYARLLAWDIFVAARVAFGEKALAAPSQRAIKHLVKRAQRNDFNHSTPSKEIVLTLGRLRSKVIPESVHTLLGLRRRYTPCPVLPLVLSPLSSSSSSSAGASSSPGGGGGGAGSARNDIAVERIVLEICAYVYTALGSTEFAIYHDHRVLYSNVSLAVTGVLQNAYHMLRTQALDSGFFHSDLPRWSGSADLDHVNDAATLIAPVHWPPGQCLTQLCQEGTPQRAEREHRLCAMWTVGHNNFASTSVEVVFVVPPLSSCGGGGNNNNMGSYSSSSPTHGQDSGAASASPHRAAAAATSSSSPSVAFGELAWSKKDPTLMWEVPDSVYPLFVLTERLNDAILFSQKRAHASSGGDGSGVSPTTAVHQHQHQQQQQQQGVCITSDGTAVGCRNVTYELHKLGYGQIYSSAISKRGGGSGSGGGLGAAGGSPGRAGGGGAGGGGATGGRSGVFAGAAAAVGGAFGSAMGGGGSGGASAAAQQQQQTTGAGVAPAAPAPAAPAFSLSEHLDPDAHELDRLVRLSGSFAYGSLRPSRELWCSGGSSYSGLFCTSSSSNQSGRDPPLVRLRPAVVPGVVLTTVAGADSSQFTLSEARHSYSFPL